MSVFTIQNVGLKDSSQFGALFLDYMSGNALLDTTYDFKPEAEGFSKALEHRKEFPVNRILLAERLTAQYKGLDVSDLTLQQIELLTQPNTYTITTGHQLCLGTGPLYLILKTLTCVKLCEELKHKHADCNFVPVFWMASEDHDAEEINHFYVFGKKYTWETDQKGAVGRFHTKGISAVLETIKDIPEWLTVAYEQSETLAEATRKIIHHLFAEYGVLVIDGDDAALKQSFSTVIEKELTTQSSYAAMTVTNKSLQEQGYSIQVNPREINLFYLKDALRERIEWKDDRFHILHTDLSFSKEELLKELAEHPDRFSPNVVLRPLYETTILPDIAYVGGPGEIAYWLQLKEVFNVYHTFLPVVFPRIFSGVITLAQFSKLQKAGMTIPELFLSEYDLKQLIVSRTDHEEVSVEQPMNSITQAFDDIVLAATSVDASLTSWAEAEKTKVVKQLQEVEKKLRKAEERKHEELIKSVLGIREKLLPNGKLQERQESVFSFFINDPEFIKGLYSSLKPFDCSIQIASYA